jgi:hypothetical protein
MMVLAAPSGIIHSLYWMKIPGSIPKASTRYVVQQQQSIQQRIES